MHAFRIIYVYIYIYVIYIYIPRRTRVHGYGLSPLQRVSIAALQVSCVTLIGVVVLS